MIFIVLYTSSLEAALATFCMVSRVLSGLSVLGSRSWCVRAALSAPMDGAPTRGIPPPTRANTAMTAMHCLVAFDVTLAYVRAAIPGSFGQLVAIDLAIVAALLVSKLEAACPSLEFHSRHCREYIIFLVERERALCSFQ